MKEIIELLDSWDGEGILGVIVEQHSPWGRDLIRVGVYDEESLKLGFGVSCASYRSRFKTLGEVEVGSDESPSRVFGKLMEDEDICYEFKFMGGADLDGPESFFYRAERCYI